MRALIVDDEPIARMVLREELELFDSVDAIDEAENGALALAKITSTSPDVVFLDIQMPVMDGFELLQQLNTGPFPAIVMVTAYDQHAIQAFDSGAIDYLLKPVSQERLGQALERAKRIVRDPAQTAEHVAKLQELASSTGVPQPKICKIVGRLGSEYFLLNADEVFAFQADGELTWILTEKQKYTATQNLKTIEQRLRNSTGVFRRIHRNALVNIDQIRKVSMTTSQRWRLTLNNGQELIVSKRQAKNVRDVLNW